MTHKLYVNRYGSRPNKILVLANYSNTEVEHVVFTKLEDFKTPEFLLKNPNGKIPVLETEKGLIFESQAIARYFARLANLYGNTLGEQGLVD